MSHKLTSIPDPVNNFESMIKRCLLFELMSKILVLNCLYLKYFIVSVLFI